MSRFPQQTPLHITMFSGGTGSNRLTRAILEQWRNEIDLTILINAYDDGKSTGKIRRDFGILGPSDIGKNLIAAIDPLQVGAMELAQFLELTLEKSLSPEVHWDQLTSVINDRADSSPFGNGYRSLPKAWQDSIRKYFTAFAQRCEQWCVENSQPIYDLRDYRLRNLLIVGALELANGDYAQGLESLRQDFSICAKILLNDTQDVHLAAITRELNLLADEAAIVDGCLDQDIEDVYLLRRRLNPTDIEALQHCSSVTALRQGLNALSANVTLNPAAVESLRNADAVVFAPTTLESSLTPTLLSKGCWQALRSAKGVRIFVANLVRERGQSSLADQLRHIEKLMQRELGQEYFLHDVIDCVVANVGLRKTGSLGGTRRIPVDRHEIESLGVELIEQDFEDPQRNGLHDGRKLAQCIVHLMRQHLTVNGSKQLVRKQDPHRVCSRLGRWLSDPLSQNDNLIRFDRFVGDVLATFGNPSASQARVVIAANGRGSRMRGSVTKVLTPIAGKPALQWLLEKALQIDSAPIVVTNDENDAPIKALMQNVAPQGRTVCVAPRGSGAAVLAALQALGPNDKTAMVLWGDAPNVRVTTMRRAIKAHAAIGFGGSSSKPAATIATSWEADPYAGIDRNALGEVIGLFQTKVDPSTRRLYGEHDASLFVLDKRWAKEVLMLQKQFIEQHQPGGEIDLLQALQRLPQLGACIHAVTVADPRESQGFNTIAEAQRISSITTDLEREATRCTQKDEVHFDVGRIRIDVPEVTLDAMQARLRKALQPTYHGFAVDVDGNLIDARERLTEYGFQKLLDVASRGVPIGLITGRRQDSLERLLLKPIIDRLGKSSSAHLKQFYVYPFNGAVGFRLDRPHERFYDRPLPSYLSAAAMRVLRAFVLGARDSYDVTDYKITIWPGDARQQSQLVLTINEWMHRKLIPMQAQVSGSPSFNGAIVMTSTEHGSHAGKAIALNDFLQRIGAGLDAVAKVGDQAGPFGVDHELLQGQGSFTTETCDPTCDNQVSLPWVTGKQHLEAFEWLVDRLDFAPLASFADATTVVSDQIKV